MVIPNMVMKFQNVEIFENILVILNLPSVYAYRVVSVKEKVRKKWSPPKKGNILTK